MEKVKMWDSMDVCYLQLNGALEAAAEFCPVVFDDFNCWKEAFDKKIAIKQCPHVVEKFNQIEFIKTACNKEWDWLINSANPNVTCSLPTDENFQVTVNVVSAAGYATSAIVLGIVLLMFLSFRSAGRSIQTMVFINLFISMILGNVLLAFWYILVVTDVLVIFSNPGWCPIMHLLTYHVLISSHFWILCHELCQYLANSRCNSIKLYLVIGWVLPGVIIVFYSVLRIYYFNDTEQCWREDSKAFYIVPGFMIGSLLITLYLKIRSHPTSDRILSLMKVAKSTLMLAPLFGFNFTLIPMHPSQQRALNKVYQLISAIVTTLQGLCLAMTFSFTNQDVIDSLYEMITRRQQNRNNDEPVTEESG